MIAALRARHRRAALCLALCAPAVLGLALAAREPIPSDPSVAALDPARTFPEGTVLALEGGPAAVVARACAPSGGGPSVLELAPERPLEAPDVLVYWSAEAGPERDAPPGDALLLGSLAGVRPRVYVLPEGALERGGTVVLYSLAHRRVVHRASTGPLPPRVGR